MQCATFTLAFSTHPKYLQDLDLRQFEGESVAADLPRGPGSSPLFSQCLTSDNLHFVCKLSTTKSTVTAVITEDVMS